MTQLLTVNSASLEDAAIRQAADVIRRGGLVAFPTETVYGLGANALDPQAVARIFEAKGRPAYDPLIVHLAGLEDLPRVAREIPEVVYRLAGAFWPGPLTLLLPRQDIVPDNVTAGLPRVAVRIPAHPVACALLQASGTPIAAPSANRFGRTSPTTARHVLTDLDGRIDLVLDGGPTDIGVESTVLDVSGPQPVILRPGGIPRERIEQVLGPVSLLTASPAAPDLAQVSPGLLEKHYAPRAELVLFEWRGSPAQAIEKMASMARERVARGERVGLLLADEDGQQLAGIEARVFLLGSEDDLETVARNLFAGLRSLDEAGVQVILARDFGEQGLGLAIRDRLRRAAARRVDA
jgi:L-threonylcarbamoyladenylate synthase